MLTHELQDFLLVHKALVVESAGQYKLAALFLLVVAFLLVQGLLLDSNRATEVVLGNFELVLLQVDAAQIVHAHA